MPIVPNSQQSTADVTPTENKMVPSIPNPPEPTPAPVNQIEAPEPISMEPVSPVVPEPSREDINLYPEGNYEDINMRVSRAREYGKTPDEAARIFNAESKTGLPTDFISQNLDDVEKESDRNSFSAADFVKKNPRFADWVSKNPNNYALAQDDMENGGELELSIRHYGMAMNLHDSILNGVASTFSNVAKVPSLAFDVISQSIPARLVQQTGLIDFEEEQRKAVSQSMRNNPITQHFDAVASESMRNNPSLQADMEYFTDAVYNRKWDVAGNIALAQMVANAPSTIVSMVMALSGAPTAAAGFGGVTQAASSASRDEAIEAGAAGTASAILQGSAEFFGERLGTLAVLEKWAGGLMTKFGRTSGKEVVKSFAKQLFSSFVQEGSEEAVTEYAQSFADIVTGVDPTAMEGVNARAIGSFLLGGASSVGFTAPFGTAASFAHFRANKQAEMQRNFYNALGESSANSKVRQKLPAKHQEMVSALTVDGPVENLYIPVDKFTELFQKYEDGGLPGAVSDLGIENEYNSAQESGGLVKIKTSAWAAKISGTDIYNKAENDITFNELEPTANQAKEALDVLSEDAMSFDPASFDGVSAVNGMTVEQQVQKMLVDSGMSPENARKNAVVYRYFDTLAKRTGKSAQQLFGEYNLSVSKYVEPAPREVITPLETMAPVKPLDITPMIEQLRAGKIPSESKVSGKSLLQYIRSKGGIKDSAEVRDLEKGLKGKKLVNKNATLEIDKIAMDAVDDGYLKEADVNELLAAIGKEISGEPVYSTKNVNDALREKQQQLNDLDSKIKALGLDPKTSTNEEIIAALESGKKIEEEITYFQSKKKDLTKTKEFKNWFQDSKVVDEDGKPLVVHHGGIGATDIEIFDTNYSGQTTGNNTFEAFHFTDGKEIAQDYSRQAFNRRYQDDPESLVTDGIVKKIPDFMGDYKKQYDFVERLADKRLGTSDVYLSIQNPIVIDNSGERVDVGYIERLTNFAKNGVDENGEFEEFHELRYGVYDEETGEYSDDVTPIDGIIIKNMIDDISPKSYKVADQFIVWDNTNIKSVENIGTFGQNEQNIFNQSKESEEIKRGRILFDSNGNFNIEFLKNADSTTFLHETAHFFLEVMGDQASKEDVSADLAMDYQKILKYLGVESRDQIKVEHHEKFAESWEKYLMEGKAPSIELRDAFSVFKGWMIAVYKSIKTMYPGIKLSDEIRGVFDRMLATEEEISRAQFMLSATPMIPNVDAVMNPEDAKKYVGLIDLERDIAADKLRAQAMKTITREVMKIKKEREIVIREMVTKDVENEPEQIVISMIRNGEVPGRGDLPAGLKNLKISKRVAQELYNEETLSKLPSGMLARDGVHPNIVSSLVLGPNVTGADLISLLVNAPNKKLRIEELVQKQMNEEFPDPTIDENFSEKAMQEIHNDPGADRRMFEIDVMMKNQTAATKKMFKTITTRKLTVAQFRTRAQYIIGATPLKDIKPNRYMRAEIKHSKDAVAMFLKGDFDGAIESKQKEILNHELYRVANDAQKDMEKYLDRFKKVFQKDEKLAKTRDINYVNAARALLSEFGIGSSENDADYYLKQMKDHDPNVYEEMKAMVETASAQADDYHNITFNAFIDLKNTFDAFWDMSKIQRQITIDGKKMDRLAAQEELITQMNELQKNKPFSDEYASAVGDQNKWSHIFGSLKSSLTRVESWADQMDNGKFDGPFRKYIWEPISRGVIQYRLDKNIYIDKFLGLIKVHSEGFSEKEIIAPELSGLKNAQGFESPGYKFKNKAELLGAMLHIGNESNLRKLLVGNKWGSLDENRNLDTSRWDTFINRMIADGTLKKEDFDFLQNTWDLMEQLKPNAWKSHYEIYGYYPSEVTAKSFTNRFGTYRGGYAPAVTDRLRVDNDKLLQKSLEEGTDANMFPSQVNGFTKSRVENYAMPLSMDLSLVPMHVDKVLRFTHITPRMRDVTKMLFDRGFKQELNAFDKFAIKGMLIPWLDRSVKQSVTEASENPEVDSFFKKMRARTGMATMFLHVTNTAQQYLGLSIAGIKVKPTFIRNATWNFIKNSKELANFAYEKSDFMKTKISFQMDETSKEISKILEKPSGFETVEQWFQNNAYVLQGIAQNQVDLIVWSAAYAEAENNELNEKVRVKVADSAVRLTQGTFAPEDVSRFETGTPLKRSFTMFSSYFNMLGNLFRSEYSKIVQQELGIKKGSERAFYVYMMGMGIPAMIWRITTQALEGKGFGPEDDDEYLNWFMGLFLGEPLKESAPLVPLIGPAVMTAVNKFDNIQWNDRISLSPSLSMLESITSLPVDVYKSYEKGKLTKGAMRDSLTLLSLLGIPVLPLSRPVGYLMDVESGRAKPDGNPDFIRGLITGKAGSQ